MNECVRICGKIYTRLYIITNMKYLLSLDEHKMMDLAMRKMLVYKTGSGQECLSQSSLEEVAEYSYCCLSRREIHVQLSCRRKCVPIVPVLCSICYSLYLLIFKCEYGQICFILDRNKGLNL